MRLEGGEEYVLGAKCEDLGVGGREGGWEESAKRKRDALRLARLLGGVSAARAKWVERGVEGSEGAGVCAECGYEGSLCRAIISGVFASCASKYTLLVPLVALLLRSSFLFSFSDAKTKAGADRGRVNAAGGKAGERWHCEVGVLTHEGESMGEERDTTYACLVSRFPVPASAANMAASSLCTATEKRRQKLGSWTMVMLLRCSCLRQFSFAVWCASVLVLMLRFE